MRRWIAVLAIVVQGCASNYVGPGPDFALKGVQADMEYQKFHLHEDDGTLRPYTFAMGADEKTFAVDSLAPVFKQVSPEAAHTLDRAIAWRSVQRYSLWVAVAMLAGAVVSSDFRTKNAFIVMDFVSCGSSLGAGVVYSNLSSEAAAEYNRALRAKFPPGVGMNWSF